MTIASLLAFGRTLVESAGDTGDERFAARIAVPALRSLLYVPGNRREWIRKCAAYGADAIILDLEDSVPAAERDSARAIIADELAALSTQVRAVWVRVNAPAALLEADLEAVVRPGLSVVQLPKVWSPEQIADLDRRLGWFEGRRGLPYRSVAISPILETAGGVRCAYEICSASDRVEYVGGIVAPEGDTALALGLDVMSDAVGTETMHLRSKIAHDARAAGVRHVVGGTVTDLHPGQETLRRFATANRHMGYTGMLVIHPSHAVTVNEIYSPSRADVDNAVQTLTALREAAGRGAVRLPSGKMVDMAHARHAVAVLAKAIAFEGASDRAP